MRAYFLIFIALALLKVNLAYPQKYNNDFSIDMYEGNNHLRYQRSNDNEVNEQGTSVEVIHNVEADEAVNTHQTKIDESISTEEAIKLAQTVMDQAAAKASEGQKTEVDAANVHLHQADTPASVAVPVTATTEEKSATVVKTEKVEETHKATAAAATETVKETATTKDNKEEKSTGISISTSKTDISMSRGSSKSKGEEVKELQAKPNYVFKYGEVLNLINQDKVNPLSSKKSKSKSKKLSKTNGNNGSSTGFSYVMVNGKEYGGPSNGPVAASKQNQNNNNQNNYGPTPSAFMPTPFGMPPQGFQGFNPMKEGTHSLRSRMGGFPGHVQGFIPPPSHNGIRMLGFNQPPAPFPIAGFRPF